MCERRGVVKRDGEGGDMGEERRERGEEEEEEKCVCVCVCVWMKKDLLTMACAEEKIGCRTTDTLEES